MQISSQPIQQEASRLTAARSALEACLCRSRPPQLQAPRQEPQLWKTLALRKLVSAFYICTALSCFVIGPADMRSSRQAICDMFIVERC